MWVCTYETQPRAAGTTSRTPRCPWKSLTPPLSWLRIWGSRKGRETQSRAGFSSRTQTSTRLHWLSFSLPRLCWFLFLCLCLLLLLPVWWWTCLLLFGGVRGISCIVLVSVRIIEIESKTKYLWKQWDRQSFVSCDRDTASIETTITPCASNALWNELCSRPPAWLMYFHGTFFPNICRWKFARSCVSVLFCVEEV